MVMDFYNRMAKYGWILLIPILVLALYIAFIPRFDYQYPVHIDEWGHMAQSKAVLKAGSIEHVNPYMGHAGIGPVEKMEVGFHVLLGVFQRISGLSWMDIFRYLPSLLFTLTVLSVYILARREGFGWEAALFTCLIPTTVGIMGPSFLVPVSMALIFVPLSLFVVFNVRTPWSYLVLFIFICFLASIHPPSTVITVITIIPSILLTMRGNLKRGLGFLVAALLPFSVAIPLSYDLILSTAKGLFSPQTLPAYHDFPMIIRLYGPIPIALCLIGTFFLFMNGGKKNYSILLGLLVITAMGAIFYTLHYGIGLLYLRGLLFSMLMIGIVAGAGLMKLRRMELPGLSNIKARMPKVVQAAGILISLVLIGYTLSYAIPIRQNISYYHMIDNEDYEAFTWIRDNVDDSYQRAILNPWKGIPFSAITGKYVYAFTEIAPTDRDMEARKFLTNGCRDTNYLVRNRISIIYTKFGCDNPALVEVNKNVYLFKKEDHE